MAERLFVEALEVPADSRDDFLIHACTADAELGDQVRALLAAHEAQDEVSHSHGGWINLRGFGTNLVTAASQLLLGPVLEAFGVVSYNPEETLRR